MEAGILFLPVAFLHLFSHLEPRLCPHCPSKVCGVLTFGILPAQFPFLDETTESLGLHEDLQEAPKALRGDSFSEGLSL